MNETNNMYFFFHKITYYGDMHMENITPSLYNISELVVPIMIS
jgi:hypothetical protein